MKPVEFAGQTSILAKEQPEYLDLPVCEVGDAVVACYALTWRDRLHLLVTGRLWYTTLTFGRPLQPQRPGAEVPPEMLDTP